MQREAVEAADSSASSHAPAGSAKDSLSSFWENLSFYRSPLGEVKGKVLCGVLPVKVCLTTDRKAGGPRKQSNLQTLVRRIRDLSVDDGHDEEHGWNAGTSLVDALHMDQEPSRCLMVRGMQPPARVITEADVI